MQSVEFIIKEGDEHLTSHYGKTFTGGSWFPSHRRMEGGGDLLSALANILQTVGDVRPKNAFFQGFCWVKASYPRLAHDNGPDTP